MAIFRVTAPSNITVTLSYQSRDSKFYSWSKTASVWQDKVHDKTEVIGLHNNQSSTGLTDKYVFDYFVEDHAVKAFEEGLLHHPVFYVVGEDGENISVETQIKGSNIKIENIDKKADSKVFLERKRTQARIKVDSNYDNEDMTMFYNMCWAVGVNPSKVKANVLYTLMINLAMSHPDTILNIKEDTNAIVDLAIKKGKELKEFGSPLINFDNGSNRVYLFDALSSPFQSEQDLRDELMRNEERRNHFLTKIASLEQDMISFVSKTAQTTKKPQQKIFTEQKVAIDRIIPVDFKNGVKEIISSMIKETDGRKVNASKNKLIKLITDFLATNPSINSEVAKTNAISHYEDAMMEVIEPIKRSEWLFDKMFPTLLT